MLFYSSNTLISIDDIVTKRNNEPTRILAGSFAFACFTRSIVGDAPADDGLEGGDGGGGGAFVGASVVGRMVTTDDSVAKANSSMTVDAVMMVDTFEQSGSSSSIRNRCIPYI